MSNASKKLMGTTSTAGGFTAIEDVFSTYLYTGDGVSASDYVVNNGIDLQNEGGLVWIKRRDIVENHALTHTDQSLNVNGFYPYIQCNNNGALSLSDAYGINAFTDTGFTMRGRSGPTDNEFNSVNSEMVSWTFRKAPRFFDVVTYTGNGLTQAINHNLGSAPGVIITKRTDIADDWTVYHRSEGATRYGFLHLTNAFATGSTRWNNTEPTDTQFFLGNDGGTNGSGGSFVAYLYAHDPLGPSGDGSDGLISCGGFSSPSGADFSGYEVDLGWEPQWVLIKSSSNAENWYIFDMMRGTPVDYSGAAGVSPGLKPNLSDSENQVSPSAVCPTPTGFRINNAFWTNGTKSHIYIAIRRGPMKVPESGTEVFSVNTSNSSEGTKITTNFPVDLQMIAWRTNTSTGNTTFVDKLRGVSTNPVSANSGRLVSSITDAEDNPPVTNGWDNTGFRTSGSYANISAWYSNFRRAHGFFDMVAYTGDGVVGRTVPHNLGVAPEMMIVKRRSGASQVWVVYHAALGATQNLKLNLTDAAGTSIGDWDNTTPTDTEFTLGSDSRTNTSATTYIAYLFATLAGVSKVGSYTGNGSSQTINCGFTSGARYILIKRTDSTGDWYVWDTARGIVAANDPHLSLNTTAAEVTTDDSVDPDSSGFIVNQVAATNINVSSASYVFYAIA